MTIVISNHESGCPELGFDSLLKNLYKCLGTTPHNVLKNAPGMLNEYFPNFSRKRQDQSGSNAILGAQVGE